MKAEQIFSYYDFDDQKKVRVATLEFDGYAHMLKSRKPNRSHHGLVSSWLNKDIQDVVELHNYSSLEEEGEKYKRDKNPKKENEKKREASIPSLNTSKTSSIKCLGKGRIASQCPNKRTMVLREDGKVVSESF
ncbi:hypothetical protein CR513_09533, partial [Mucuna pruriens]